MLVCVGVEITCVQKGKQTEEVIGTEKAGQGRQEVVFLRTNEKAKSATGSERRKGKKQTEAIRSAAAGVHAVRSHRLSDRDSRAEALGYTKETRRTKGDSAVRRFDAAQRESGALERMIVFLNTENATEPFKVRFDGRGVDASVSRGDVGSLYFGNGRFRLTHKHGPEISEKEEIWRFAVQGDWKKMNREIEACKGREREESIEYLREMSGYVMKEITGDNFPWGRLVELYFKDGKLTGSHLSRGRLKRYTITPPKEDCETGTEQNEESSGAEEEREKSQAEREQGVKEQQELAMEIGRVVAASQRFGAYIGAALQDENIESRDMTSDAMRDIVKRVIQQIMRRTGEPRQNEIPNELAILANDDNVETAITVAKEEAEGMTAPQYTNVFRQRIQGYFANQVFHLSGIAGRMGIRVAQIDQLPKRH